MNRLAAILPATNVLVDVDATRRAARAGVVLRALVLSVIQAGEEPHRARATRRREDRLVSRIVRAIELA